ncbi:hypothetical protein D1007_60657 [Hordeum vulgare]|nr:hypothetical protein D1007_60657 [Hordeum vulgare]
MSNRGLVVDDGGSSSNNSSSASLEDEDLEEEAVLSMEDRMKMAEIWVVNPTGSHHWTRGAGGGLIEALLSLHITQAKDFRYHRNSDQRIIACCQQEHCQFCIVAAVIKGEKTFAIKKMRLEHTCPTNTEQSRISAKWIAKTYESLFMFDPTTSIHTLIVNSMDKYGVDVGRHVAYMSKNLVVEVVLGEHKKQYPRLRDYAQTIMDTNPGNRVVVTTVTPKPTTNTPHPGPKFHAMFFYINGAREGFLNGCRPFIG